MLHCSSVASRDATKLRHLSPDSGDALMLMKIKTRLLVYLIPSIVLALTLMTVFAYRYADRQARALAFMEADNIVLEHSGRIFDNLRRAEASALSLAYSLNELRQLEGPGREAMRHVVRGVTISSQDYFGAWALWEPNAFDGKDAEFIDHEELGNSQGRANVYWFRKEGGGFVYDPSEDYDHESFYALPKRERRPIIVPPYRDMGTEKHTLMTSLTVPIMDGGKVIGVAGIDIDLEFIHGLINKITPYETGHAMLISDQGAIIASSRDKNDKTVGADLPQVSAEVLRKIREGKAFTDTGTTADGAAALLFFTPVELRSFAAPWYFMVALPLDKVMAGSNRNLIIQLGISFTALMVLIGLVFYTAESVSSPLRRMAAHAQEVAGGRYEAALDERGFVTELKELHSALASMLGSLLASMKQAEEQSQAARQEAEKAREATEQAERAREVVEADHRSMLEVAERVDAVSQKLQETSQVLNEKILLAGHETRGQSQLMGETVVTISGMYDSIVRVSDNAASAADFAERSRTRAEEGAGIVNDTIQAVATIYRDTEALAGQIDDLGKQTAGIGSILGMINDIADQTNLLALNAAIEAARAGEAGRGFAVVADEVRKLAEKTVEATKQVEESVNGIRASMRVSAQGVAHTAETVSTTVTLGQSAQEALSDIVNLVKTMNEQIHEIAALCREQANTSEQVAGTVDRLRQISIAVDEVMDESAAITRSLEPEARELGVLVDQLSQST